jgi:hypothetical protein
MNDHLKNQLATWDGLFKDHAGQPSSSRSLMVLYGVGTFVIWAVASLKSATLQEIPDAAITIFGVLISGKTLQGQEKSID